MEHDWIRLFRKITDWQWYGQPDIMTLFIHLLIHATDKDVEQADYSLKRGQLLTTHAKLLEKLDLGRSTLRTCLNRLVSSGEITMATCNKYTLVTICNYDIYQSKEIPKPTIINEDCAISQQQDIVERVTNDIQELKDKFNEFRILYPGRKRGLETELKTLQKHKDWRDIIPLLIPAVKLYIEHTKGSKYIKNLQTWLNNRCWETEYNNQSTEQNDERYKILKGEPLRGEQHYLGMQK